MSQSIVTTSEPPENVLWFVRNGKLTPRQGQFVVFSLVAIHIILAVFVSYFAFHKFNYFTVLIFSLLIIAGFIGRKEIYHWFPIYFFLALYDILAVFQELFVYHIDPVNFYTFDDRLFGWAFNNEPPSYYFYQHHIPALDVFFGVFYVIHIIFPPIVIIYVRIYHEDKFDRLAWSSVFLGIICMLFYYLLPTAPPWYTMNYGFSNQYVTQITIDKAEAGLWYTDQALGVSIFSKIMWNMTSAKFSSFPSMHVGAPAYIYFSCKKLKINSISRLMGVYVILIFCAVIYLNHHWVADALGGLFFAWLSVVLANRVYDEDGIEKATLEAAN